MTTKHDTSTQAAADDNWITWSGGACPIPAGTKHAVRFCDGVEVQDDGPESWRWLHDGTSSDIVAYKVLDARPMIKPIPATTPDLWRTEATTQRAARGVAESRLEIATDLLREADEHRGQPLPDDLRGRIDRFLQGDARGAALEGGAS